MSGNDNADDCPGTTRRVVMIWYYILYLTAPWKQSLKPGGLSHHAVVMKMSCLWINSKRACQASIWISKKWYCFHFQDKIGIGVVQYCCLHAGSACAKYYVGNFTKAHILQFPGITIEFHVPINIVINGLGCIWKNWAVLDNRFSLQRLKWTAYYLYKYAEFRINVGENRHYIDLPKKSGL